MRAGWGREPRHEGYIFAAGPACITAAQPQM